MEGGFLLVSFLFLGLVLVQGEDQFNRAFQYPRNMRSVGWEKFSSSTGKIKQQKHVSPANCEIARIECYKYRTCEYDCPLQFISDGGYIMRNYNAEVDMDMDNRPKVLPRTTNPCLESIAACYGFDIEEIKEALHTENDFQYWYEFVNK